MTITYAGQPLLLEDPGRHLSTWIERAISLKDLRLFGEHPLALQDGRWLPRSSSLAKVGLPTANWSAPPRMKLNTLWLPTGATRWSIGLFLADKQTVAGITERVDSSGRADLTLGRGASPETHPMHLLPPHPLTALGGPAGDALGDPTYERLFLLPLVDERYFWQWRDAGELEVDPCMSWADLIDYLASQLGTTVECEAIDEPYGHLLHARTPTCRCAWPNPYVRIPFVSRFGPIHTGWRPGHGLSHPHRA